MLQTKIEIGNPTCTRIDVIGLRSEYAKYICFKLREQSWIRLCYREYLYPSVSGFLTVWKNFSRNRLRYGIRYAIDNLAYFLFVGCRENPLDDVPNWPSKKFSWKEVLKGCNHTQHDTFADAKALARLAEGNPDIIVLAGAPIIPPEMLSLEKIAVVNLHAGILPEYRGVASEVWGLAHANFTGLGFTIHIVDTQLDHGAILRQTVINSRKGESIKELRKRILAQGAQAFVDEIIKVARDRQFSGVNQRQGGKVYSFPTLTAYIYANLNLKRKVSLYYRF